jgi:hypothetical protein
LKPVSKKEAKRSNLLNPLTHHKNSKTMGFPKSGEESQGKIPPD